MQFSDTTGKTGIIQQCEQYCGFDDAGISSQATTLKLFTAKANKALQKIWSVIFQAYGGWIFDDANNTDLPQATTNLVLGQRRYALPSYALSIIRLEVTDGAGITHLVQPLPLERVPEATPEFFQGNGIPQFYRLMDGAIELYPAADANVTDGMEAYFDRAMSDFASTDTTKTPGFASPFHYLVPVIASIDHLTGKQASSATLKELKQDRDEGLQACAAYYNKRWRELRPRVTPGGYDWS